ncbi:hypothetical protein V1477_014843 [Vespula maculifrons]|uniref:Uncharacterized protein n=1 Tax=Vespula maculifrons TaxID=7453 RepID=A0ABD2BIM3_VESMC
MRKCLRSWNRNEISIFLDFSNEFVSSTCARKMAPNHHTFLIPSTLYKSNRRYSGRDRSRVVFVDIERELKKKQAKKQKP